MQTAVASFMMTVLSEYSRVVESVVRDWSSASASYIDTCVDRDAILEDYFTGCTDDTRLRCPLPSTMLSQ